MYMYNGLCDVICILCAIYTDALIPYLRHTGYLNNTGRTSIVDSVPKLFSLRNPFRRILNLVVKFSSFKSVPIPSYEPARRRRNVPGPGTRMGSTLLFSTTARFCDIKQRRNCSLFDF